MASTLQARRRELERDKRELEARTSLPTSEQMELLVRNVSRDAAPLSSAELNELRAMRDRIGLVRWESWLELARERRKKKAKKPDDIFLRRLDAARGAALFASAVAADARDATDDPDARKALQAAEDQLRAFADTAVDLLQDDPKPRRRRETTDESDHRHDRDRERSRDETPPRRAALRDDDDDDDDGTLGGSDLVDEPTARVPRGDRAETPPPPSRSGKKSRSGGDFTKDTFADTFADHLRRRATPTSDRRASLHTPPRRSSRVFSDGSVQSRTFVPSSGPVRCPRNSF